MSIPERQVTAVERVERPDSHSVTLRLPAFNPDIDLLEQLKGKTPEEFRAVIRGATEAILNHPDRESVKSSDFEELGVKSKATLSLIRRVLLDELGLTKRRLGRSIDYILDPAKIAFEKEEEPHQRILKEREEGLPESTWEVLSLIRDRNLVSRDELIETFAVNNKAKLEELDGHLFILVQKRLVGARSTVAGVFYRPW